MGALRQFPLRMLAPLSLAAFAVVFLIVIVSSLDSGSTSSDSDRSTRPGRARTTTEQRSQDLASQRRAYVVRRGDTLATIATRTGIPVADLLALNPEIDPQALVTGQRIKLRR